MTFRGYLTRHRDCDSPTSDIAKNVFADSHLKGVSSYRSIANHIRDAHNPSAMALEALEAADAQFRRGPDAPCIGKTPVSQCVAV
jgi:hypothetical protein